MEGPTEHPGSLDLVGGVVAFNEERRLIAAVESLIEQRLPKGARWRALWIVASGCTDRTVEVARALATRYPEVRVLVQAERCGKASALREIFRKARGDHLVLLNADAVAAPHSVEALLSVAERLRPPYAVMGRPVPGALPPGGLGNGLRLLWNLHHRLHQALIETGEGTHLSDELLLLPLSHLPPLSDDVVNDGAFVGAWLRSVGGLLGYASEARVTVEVPWSFGDHLRQRRRIHFGHRQVAGLVGITPTTMGEYVRRHPARAWRILRAEVQASPQGLAALVWLLSAEVVATAAAGWDRIPPRRDHRLWETIRDSLETPTAYEATVARTSTSPAPFDRGG